MQFHFSLVAYRIDFRSIVSSVGHERNKKRTWWTCPNARNLHTHK
ncbi:hypothetical protein CIPAW_08G119100 [Carya illinoinensis]|uniref:Uncharacterized protein n=1 Tax=Carya illinoinensis TaxID=32201 RepID=A0A8T1PVK1_CARIL|nr:hypothetical protein CIPAW_08G119100 [Carya illinoinensis]